MMPPPTRDSILALLPDTKEHLTFRVPCPLGFFARRLDGRIDDPNRWWKGRGLWSTCASSIPENYEGGVDATSKAIKFLLRRNPLAY